MRRTILTTIVGSLCFFILAPVAWAQGDVPKVDSPQGMGEAGQLLAVSLETGRNVDGHFLLQGTDSRQQLVVTGEYDSGQRNDLTRDVFYESSPPGVVSVSSTGLVMPLANGQAEIKASHATGVSSSMSVVVEGWNEIPLVNFPNQIVPIFTKLSCNGGGCHGKSGGQNGFRLSLLGFEPAEDYEHLLKEARGRRLSVATPDQSLLLLKVTGATPHGGGQRMEVSDPTYRLIHRWIAQGAPFGDPAAAKVAAIEVFPKSRIMPTGGKQQLVVVAHYTDGGSEDVTALAQFDTNVAGMAEVNERGQVEILEQTGDVAVMIRYQSQVAVFRATIPLGAPVEELPPTRNFVDDLVFKKLKLLGVPPSRVCSEEEFLRRVTIDLTGRLPTLEEVESFLGDTTPDKRDRWIETLLASRSYADYFANKWTVILRNKRNGSGSRRGTYAFHYWVRRALHRNLPYDQFVRGIITASGEIGVNPPVAWYREVNELNEQVEDTAQLFLGLRIQCARCHHHPFERWSRRDYHSFAAFFSRVGRKPGSRPGEERIFHQRGVATAVNPKNGETISPAGLGARPLELTPETDPRHALVDWMVSPDNPHFAPTLVNRYWKHFFSRGLVDPEDDIRETNPATNPELLNALARQFIDTGFDLKGLIRTICQSSTYQLSSEPNRFNAEDKQNYSRYYPRRLQAEVLLDSIDQVAGAVTQFDGMPSGTRAVQLPDSGFDVYFLKVFGRPEADSACECERAGDASLAQSLHLINSADLLGKMSADSGRAARLAGDVQRDHDEKIEELFLIAMCRRPTAEEASALIGYVERKTTGENANARQAYEDVMWMLLNTKEFLFNH